MTAERPPPPRARSSGFAGDNWGTPSDKISESSAIFKLRVKPAQDSLRRIDRVAARSRPDRDDRRQCSTETLNRMLLGKVSLQNQKPRHPRRIHVAQIIPPIRFDRTAASQHRHPVQVAQRAVENLFVGFENVVFRLDHPASHVRPLQIFRQLGELPSLIVRQRLVGQSLEQHRPRHDRAEKLIRRFIEPIRRILAPKRPIQHIEIFPHLGGNVLAYPPRVLPRAGHAVQDAVRILGIEREILSNPLREIRPIRQLRRSKDRQQALPLPRLQRRRKIADVNQQIRIHQHQPRHVLRSLDIPRHPIHRIRIARASAGPA